MPRRLLHAQTEREGQGEVKMSHFHFAAANPDFNCGRILAGTTCYGVNGTRSALDLSYTPEVTKCRR